MEASVPMEDLRTIEKDELSSSYGEKELKSVKMNSGKVVHLRDHSPFVSYEEQSLRLGS